ncbi:MAG: DNA replication complex subunit Gins51 [Candidatus Asgardarchaeia archaeon]
MYDELRKVQIEERKSATIVNLPPDFYRKINAYIKKIRDELVKKWDPVKARELENTLKVLGEIKKRRAEKILILAFNQVFNGIDEEVSLTDEEKTLLNRAVGVVRSFKEDSEKVEKEKNTLKIRALKSMPSFKGMDGEEYGPFREGEIYEVPPKEGEVLIKGGMAEPV